MGNSQSVEAAESAAAEAKVRLDECVTNYLEYLEVTSTQIDTEIEDLSMEIATVTTQFKVSNMLKALPADKALLLQEDVEKYANLHKFSIRRLFGVLEEGYDTFEDMCYAITLPDDDDDEDMIHWDDYEPSEGDEEDEDEDENGDEQECDEEDEDEDENGDEQEEEQSLPSEDDEDDDDYNTAAAEEELAAELNSDDEEEDESEDEEDSNDYEDYQEVVTDEEVLYTARIACKELLDQYSSEMNSIGLPTDLLATRHALLRRMLYKAAEAHVADAVSLFVSSYRRAALEDIDNLLCLGMTSGSLSSEDPEEVRAALRNIISVNAVARQALEDLPFTQREAIEVAAAEIQETTQDVIRRVQLLNVERPRVLEMLMDLDMDDFGSEDNESIDGLDSDDNDDDDDDDDVGDGDDDDDDVEGEKLLAGGSRINGAKQALPKPSPKLSTAPKRGNKTNAPKPQSPPKQQQQRSPESASAPKIGKRGKAAFAAASSSSPAVAAGSKRKPAAASAPSNKRKR